MSGSDLLYQEVICCIKFSSIASKTLHLYEEFFNSDLMRIFSISTDGGGQSWNQPSYNAAPAYGGGGGGWSSGPQNGRSSGPRNGSGGGPRNGHSGGPNGSGGQFHRSRVYTGHQDGGFGNTFG